MKIKGGQSIPAWDFYMAPYVRLTFEEEFENIKNMFGFKGEINLDEVIIQEYVIREIEDDATLVHRMIQSAINNTVARVHQAMEAFIHNMNTIHSRGKDFCPVA